MPILQSSPPGSNPAALCTETPTLATPRSDLSPSSEQSISSIFTARTCRQVMQTSLLEEERGLTPPIIISRPLYDREIDIFDPRNIFLWVT